ncbi:hypothetical protein MIMGU_mgv1a0009922mg, partial [Erythranthe guttata]
MDKVNSQGNYNSE